MTGQHGLTPSTSRIFNGQWSDLPCRRCGRRLEPWRRAHSDRVLMCDKCAHADRCRYAGHPGISHVRPRV